MFGFFIAVGAGFLTPQIQEALAPVVAKALSFLSIEEKEYDVVGFMLVVLGAGFLATVFGSGNALGVAIGVILGYFAKRIVSIVMEATSGRPKE